MPFLDDDDDRVGDGWGGGDWPIMGQEWYRRATGGTKDIFWSQKISNAAVTLFRSKRPTLNDKILHLMQCLIEKEAQFYVQSSSITRRKCFVADNFEIFGTFFE